MGKVATIITNTKAMSGRSGLYLRQRDAVQVKEHWQRVSRVTREPAGGKACPSDRRYLFYKEDAWSGNLGGTAEELSAFRPKSGRKSAFFIYFLEGTDK